MTETADYNSAAMANALRQPRLQNSISIDEEVRERLNVTPEELAEIGADVYGSPARVLGADCPAVGMNEKALLDEGLRTLDAELARIPAADKTSFVEATRINPALVDVNHRMLFLRSEDMDSKRAAKRIVMYWQKRHELFGSEKCYCPLTLNGALRNDKAAWSQEFCQLLPSKDKFGRAILLFDPSRLDRSKYSPDSLLRVIWYIHHVAINDREAQRCDAVVIINGRNATVSSFAFASDGDFNRRLADMDQHSPVKMRAIHVCHPNWLIFMMLPVYKFLNGRKVRLRCMVHGGSDAKVMDELSHYGLTPDMLPIELGGGVNRNAEKWVQSRIDIEISAASSRICQKEGSKTDNIAIPVKTLKSNSMQVPKPKRPPGRRSDPRMDKALIARQTNPHLSLLDALVEGGFKFANIGLPGARDSNTFDEDGVSILQRKNQLMRRLRLSRPKHTAAAHSQLC